MRHSLPAFLIFLALLSHALPAGAAQDPGDALRALFEETWERDMREDPVRASEFGDLRYNDRWPDLSPAAMKGRNAANAAALKKLQAIPRDALSPADRINYDLFQRDLENRLSIYRFGRETVYHASYDEPRGQRDGVHTAYELAERLSFRDEQAYRDWIARLEAFGTYVDQSITLYRQSITDRIVPPKIIIERIRDQVLTLFSTDPTASPFYDPFRQMPADMPAELKSELRAAAQAAITDVVIPAARRYGQFIADQYLPAGRETFGALRNMANRTSATLMPPGTR